jgi:hypothetical protein
MEGIEKKAVLVYTSFVTRVVVDEDASDDDIILTAKQKFNLNQAFDEFSENVEEIVEDEECPFDCDTESDSIRAKMHRGEIEVVKFPKDMTPEQYQEAYTFVTDTLAVDVLGDEVKFLVVLGDGGLCGRSEFLTDAETYFDYEEVPQNIIRQFKAYQNLKNNG